MATRRSERIWFFITLAISAGFLLIILAAAGAFAQSAPVAVQPQFDVKLSAGDGGNINQICTFAMDGQQSLSTKTAIGQFCLDLLGRIGQAQSAAKVAQGSPSAAPAAMSGEKK